METFREKHKFCSSWRTIRAVSKTSLTSSWIWISVTSLSLSLSLSLARFVLPPLPLFNFCLSFSSFVRFHSHTWATITTQNAHTIGPSTLSFFFFFLFFSFLFFFFSFFFLIWLVSPFSIVLHCCTFLFVALFFSLSFFLSFSFFTFLVFKLIFLHARVLRVQEGFLISEG